MKNKNTTSLLIIALLFGGAMLGSPLSASAELWTQDGNNIYINNGGKVGIGAAAPASFLTINPGTPLVGDSAAKNFLNITGTLAATNTAQANGVNFSITSNGSSSQPQSGLNAVLSSGYTGSSSTRGATILNGAAGTGTGWISSGAPTANYGVFVTENSVTTGTNIGLRSAALGSSNINVGLYGQAAQATNSPLLNVGTSGIALNAATNVGGFFALMTANPVLASSAALIADNGATTSDIFVARDNGGAVFKVLDGGNVKLSGNIVSDNDICIGMCQ